MCAPTTTRVYTFTNFYPQEVADDQRFNVLLRENYLDVGAGDWDFRLGRQQIVWGEMVGLLFGDVVSARDLRQFILPKFEILRIPQWAARAEYFKDDFHAELIWIPVPSYDNIGKPGSEFFAYTPPLPPGIATVFRNQDFPERSLENTNYGLRLSVLRDGWDVAAFAYSSMSVAPTFYRELVVNPLPTAIFEARNDRINQLGATMAKDFGSVVLKGETVYTHGRNYEVTDLTDIDGVVPQNTLTWVLGLDFNQFDDTRINAQIFQNHFFDHNPYIIPDADTFGYSLLVSHKLNARVEAQALWISNVNGTDWMLRPRVTWNFEKNLSLALGVDVFNGPPTGYFGRYDAKTASIRRFFTASDWLCVPARQYWSGFFIGSHRKGTAGENQPVPFAELRAVLEYIAAHLGASAPGCAGRPGWSGGFPSRAGRAGHGPAGRLAA